MSPSSNITPPTPLVFSSLSYGVVWFVTCAKQKECQHSRHLEYLSLANVLLLYVSLPFTSSNRPLLVFTLNIKVEKNGILILYGSFVPERCGSVHNVSVAAFTHEVARVASCRVEASQCRHSTNLYRIFLMLFIKNTRIFSRYKANAYIQTFFIHRLLSLFSGLCLKGENGSSINVGVAEAWVYIGSTWHEAVLSAILCRQPGNVLTLQRAVCKG